MADDNLKSIADILQKTASGADFNSDNWVVDADTLQDKETGLTKRVVGFNAPETTKVLGEGDELVVKPGTPGGNAATGITIDLAKQLGYTNVVGTGESGFYGRELVSLQNEEGERFEGELIAHEVFDVSQGTLQKDILRREALRAVGGKYQDETSGTFKEAAGFVNNAIDEAGGKGLFLKSQALDEAEYARAKENPETADLFSKDLLYQNHDRNLKNEARNPLSSSVGIAMRGVQESLYGASAAFGDAINSDDIQLWGDAGTARVRDAQRLAPKVLTDYKDIEGAGDFMQFLGNNIIISLPYMATTFIATAAAPVTGGLSLSVPMSLYAGQIYNEQDHDKKNVLHAAVGGVAQTIVDRFALKAIPGQGYKEIYKGAVDKLVKQGATREIAELTVGEFTKRQLAGFMRESADVVARQLSAKNAVKNILTGVARGVAVEAPTEAIQEGIGYVAANLEGDEPLNYEEMLDRMIQGAAAGGPIGGAFGGGASTLDTGGWYNAVHRAENIDKKLASDIDKRKQRAQEADGTVQSVDEILAAAGSAESIPSHSSMASDIEAAGEDGALEVEFEADKADESPTDDGDSFEDRTRRGDETHKDKTLGARAWKKFSGVKGLWRASIDTLIPEGLRDRSPTVNKMYDLFYGGRGTTHSGATFEEFKSNKLSVWANNLPSPAQLFRNVLGGKRDSSPEFSPNRGVAPSRLIAAAVEMAQVPGQPGQPAVYDISRIPEDTQGRAAIIEYIHSIQKISTGIEAEIKEHTPNSQQGITMSVVDYLMGHKSVRPEIIAKDIAGFVRELAKMEFNGLEIGTSKAQEIARVLADGSITSVDEAASHILGQPANPLLETPFSKMQADPLFAKFFQENAYNNLLGGLQSLANYIGHQKYIGDGFSKPQAMLNDAVRRGEITDAEADEIATGLNDYFLAERGQYKKFTSEAGIAFDGAQKNAMFLTTIVTLPFSAISSLVEVVVASMGVGVTSLDIPKQIGKELGHKFIDVLSGSKDFVTREAHEPVVSTARSRVEELGLGGWVDDIATTVGATQGSVAKQNILSYYFKKIQLRDVTQSTRAIRQSLFADFFAEKVETILNETGYQYKSKDRLDAEAELGSLGVDIRELARLSKLMAEQNNGVELSAADAEFVDKETRLAEQRFINQAVALPGTANRPLFYKDPRFRLVTHLQGFISTFQANQLPRMWNQYIKNGNPAMKFQTFSTVMLMIGMGFATQELKDWIKYGDGDNYLDGLQEGRRAVSSSGILGVGDRFNDLFFPLYESENPGFVEKVGSIIEGQSPVASKVSNVLSTVGDAYDGNARGAGNQFLKVFGVPARARHAAVNKFIDGGDYE